MQKSKLKFNVSIAFTIIVISLLMNSCNNDDENTSEQPDLTIKGIIDDINADSLQKDIQLLQNMGSRFALANNRKEVALKIKKKFIQLGYSNATLDSFYTNYSYRGTTYNTWQYNVIATLEGVEYPDNICIMGGHYDSIVREGDAFLSAPGANDNASGVAATFEVARALKKHNFIPKMSIQFIAFGAEEIGLMGSTNYVRKAANSQKKIMMMLNNDMIAYWPESLSPMVVNIIDYPISTKLRLEAEKICVLYTTLATNNDNEYSAYSDSYPFYQWNYSAIFFISDSTDPFYHTINDISSKYNFNFCREVTKISGALLVKNNKL